MPEQHQEYREGARNAAPTYPARMETRAIVRDTCAGMESRASPEPSRLLRNDDFRDSKCNQRSSELGSLHLQAMVDPHEHRSSVVVAQDDVDEAANKAADAQLELRLLMIVPRRRRGLRMRSGSRTTKCLSD